MKDGTTKQTRLAAKMFETHYDEMSATMALEAAENFWCHARDYWAPTEPDAQMEVNGFTVNFGVDVYTNDDDECPEDDMSVTVDVVRGDSSFSASIPRLSLSITKDTIDSLWREIDRVLAGTVREVVSRRLKEKHNDMVSIEVRKRKRNLMLQREAEKRKSEKKLTTPAA